MCGHRGVPWLLLLARWSLSVSTHRLLGCQQTACIMFTLEPCPAAPPAAHHEPQLAQAFGCAAAEPDTVGVLPGSQPAAAVQQGVRGTAGEPSAWPVCWNALFQSVLSALCPCPAGSHLVRGELDAVDAIECAQSSLACLCAAGGHELWGQHRGLHQGHRVCLRVCLAMPACTSSWHCACCELRGGFTPRGCPTSTPPEARFLDPTVYAFVLW